MIHRVDWISYTLQGEPIDESAMHRFRAVMLDRLPDYINADFVSDTTVKRPGFNGGLAIGNHTYVFMNRSGLMLVEHTGEGCRLLEECETLDQVMRDYADRMTRLDIATDILTDAKPKAFADSRQAQKHTAYGEQTSASGQTIYIGSKKSDRYCRVYRYNEPHPRAAWLRIEYVYRKEQARVIAHAINQAGIDDVAVSSGIRYKWAHECYKPHETASMREIGAWRPERRQSKTVRWLLTQAAPSLAAMIDSGELTMEDFIAQVVKERAENKGIKQERLL